MRKLLCILCCMNVLWCTAQEQPAPDKLNKNSIVIDSAGVQYPYMIWQKLVQSGEYSVHRKKGESVFVLRKLTEAQINKRDSSRQVRLEKMQKPAESKFFTTGDKISSFRITDMNGNKWNLKELKGKVVVLNFWFVGCPPCRKEIPELNKLVEAYKDSDNVVFIAVALDDKYAIQEFIKTTPYNYHIIDDGRSIAERQYGINLYPTNVVVDRNGNVQFHTSGYQANLMLWLRATIDKSLHTD